MIISMFEQNFFKSIIILGGKFPIFFTTFSTDFLSFFQSIRYLYSPAGCLQNYFCNTDVFNFYTVKSINLFLYDLYYFLSCFRIAFCIMRSIYCSPSFSLVQVFNDFFKTCNSSISVSFCHETGSYPFFSLSS